MIRLAKLIAGLFVLWMLVLFVLGFVLAGTAERGVTARLGESLQGKATIGDRSLGLIGGGFTFEKLSVRREDVLGHLALDVGEVDCDLPPLGIALVDRTCGTLEIRDVRLDVSAIALFKIKRPKRTPFRADEVIVDNADLTFAPSAFLPGLGKVRIVIEHAAAGPTSFKQPLSFLFALTELRAVLELPAGIAIRLRYETGVLRASGTLFGSTPVEIPLELPKADSADDAQAEIKKLVVFGKDLAERLVRQRAEDWLRKRLPIP